MPFVYIPDSYEPEYATRGAGYPTYSTGPSPFYEPAFAHPRHRHQPQHHHRHHPSPVSPVPHSYSAHHPQGRHPHPQPPQPPHTPHHHSRPAFDAAGLFDAFESIDLYGQPAYSSFDLDRMDGERRRALLEEQTRARARAELQLREEQEMMEIQREIQRQRLQKEKEKEKERRREKMIREESERAVRQYLMQREQQAREERAREERAREERAREERQQLADRQRAQQHALDARRQRALAERVRSCVPSYESESEAVPDVIRYLLEMAGHGARGSAPTSTSTRTRAPSPSPAPAPVPARVTSPVITPRQGEFDLAAFLTGLSQPSQPSQPSQSSQHSQPVPPATHPEEKPACALNPMELLLKLVEAASAPKSETDKNDQPPFPSAPSSADKGKAKVDGAVTGWPYVSHPSASAPAPQACPHSISAPRASTPRTSSSLTPAPQTSSHPTARTTASPSTTQPSVSNRARLRALDEKLSALLDSPEKPLGGKELQNVLTNLLIEADGIESEGDEGVRKQRKRFVSRVEKVLDGLVASELEQPQPPQQHDQEETALDIEPLTTSSPSATPPTVESSSPIDTPYAAPELEVFIPITSPEVVPVDLAVEESSVPISTLGQEDAPSSPSSPTSPTLPSSSPSSSVAPSPEALVLSGSVDGPETSEAESDASSDVSDRSPPSSPRSRPVEVKASGTEAGPSSTRRSSSVGSASSSTSSRRGRKAYVEDAPEEEEFQLV